jgi:hypothetical protein
MLLDNGEPTNYEEAVVGPDSDKWLGAMKSEIGSIYENKVWTLVDLPYDRQAIKNKWIHKKRQTLMVISLSIKLDLSQRVFDKFKGVDYDETFSTVATLKSVIIMLAIAAFYEIWQMDVKTEFLNGFLEEVLYVMQPEGFVNPMVANQVCKL